MFSKVIQDRNEHFKNRIYELIKASMPLVIGLIQYQGHVKNPFNQAV